MLLSGGLGTYPGQTWDSSLSRLRDSRVGLHLRDSNMASLEVGHCLSFVRRARSGPWTQGHPPSWVLQRSGEKLERNAFGTEPYVHCTKEHSPCFLTLPLAPHGSLMDFKQQELSKAADIYLLSLCRRLSIPSVCRTCSLHQLWALLNLKPLGWQQDCLDNILCWSCYKSHCPGDLPWLLPPEKVVPC